jgi:hypothetical protein
MANSFGVSAAAYHALSQIPLPQLFAPIALDTGMLLAHHHQRAEDDEKHKSLEASVVALKQQLVKQMTEHDASRIAWAARLHQVEGDNTKLREGRRLAEANFNDEVARLERKAASLNGALGTAFDDVRRYSTAAGRERTLRLQHIEEKKELQTQLNSIKALLAASQKAADENVERLVNTQCEFVKHRQRARDEYAILRERCEKLESDAVSQRRNASGPSGVLSPKSSAAVRDGDRETVSTTSALATPAATAPAVAAANRLELVSPDVSDSLNVSLAANRSAGPAVQPPEDKTDIGAASPMRSIYHIGVDVPALLDPMNSPVTPVSASNDDVKANRKASPQKLERTKVKGKRASREVEDLRSCQVNYEKKSRQSEPASSRPKKRL